MDYEHMSLGRKMILYVLGNVRNFFSVTYPSRHHMGYYSLFMQNSKRTIDVFDRVNIWSLNDLNQRICSV